MSDRSNRVTHRFVVSALACGIALVAILMGVPAIAAAGGPATTSISPTSAAAGTQVTVTGSGFGATQGSSYLSLADWGNNWGAPGDSASLIINSWSDTAITFTVPTPSGPGNQWAVVPNTAGIVSVTVGGATSNTQAFLVTSAASTSISPTSAAAGAQVTLTGSGFGATQGSSYLSLADWGNNWGNPGGSALTINSWSNTAITFTVPTPSGNQAVVPNTAGVVSVTVGGITSNIQAFLVNPAAQVISPSSAAAGAQVTLTGSGFGTTQGSSYLSLADWGNNWGNPGGSALTINSWSNTAITFTVPTPSGNQAVVPNTAGVVSVTVGGITSNIQAFLVNPAAQVISPSSAAAGAQVTLTGSGFGTTQGSSYLSLADWGNNWGNPGGSALTINSWSNTAITFTVPTPSGNQAVVPNTAGVVSVTVGGITSNIQAFLVNPAAQVISPSSAAAGAQVTLTGSGFGTTQGSSYLSLADWGNNWGNPGGSALTINSWSNTAITFTVPTPSGNQAVVPNTAGVVSVTVGGITSNIQAFLVNPAAQVISPSSAAAGAQVTLTGSGFGTTQGSSYLSLADWGNNWGNPGGSALTINSWSNTAITFTVPTPSGNQAVVPNTAGVVSVTVGGITSNIQAFLVDGVAAHPATTSISPTSAAAGAQVTVTGSGFGVTQGSSYLSLADWGISWGAPSDAASFTINSWSNTAITFTAPTPSGPGNVWALVPNSAGIVSVTVGGVTSNTQAFLVRSVGVYSVPSPGQAVADGWPIIADTGALGTSSSPYTGLYPGGDLPTGEAAASANHGVSWLSFWTVSGPVNMNSDGTPNSSGQLCPTANCFETAAYQAGQYVAQTIDGYAGQGLSLKPAFVIIDPEGYPDSHSGLDSGPGSSTSNWDAYISGWGAGLASVDPSLHAGFYADQYEYNTFGLASVGQAAFIAVAFPGPVKNVSGSNITGYIAWGASCPAKSEENVLIGWGASLNTLQFPEGQYCAP